MRDVTGRCVDVLKGHQGGVRAVSLSLAMAVVTQGEAAPSERKPTALGHRRVGLTVDSTHRSPCNAKVG